MAQSPESNTDTAGSAYAKSWDALGALIAQGKSFSGRERNCAFLNLGAKVPSFACASGAVNLDQIDDSRAVIPADWDGDGDLDLWYSNRTAPRLRFLRNDVVSGTHWLTLKLEGRTSNRDAIGARAELTLAAADGTRRTLWRRVKAGDGFLSQTPKTLHFGFRADEKIEKLLVRWPAPGFDEVILPAVEADHFYAVTQGSGAKSLERKPLPPLTAGAAALPEEKAAVRAVLVNRLPVPKLDYFDHEGRQQSIGAATKPTLVLLWGSWCPLCRTEMAALSAQAAALSGLRILALAVDTAKSDPTKDDLENARRALAARPWPFEAGFATQEAVRGLALLESKALYPERALPLPSAYLLSPDGRLSYIYHGPVTAAQLAQDAAAAAQTPADPEAAAFPFPGRSAKPLFPLTVLGLVQTLLDAGYHDEARRELERQLAITPAKEAAVLHNQLGKVWQALGDHTKARAAFTASLAAAPESAEITFNLAVASQFTGDTAAAIAGYESALKLKPDLLDAASNLVWLLATAKDEKLRQPARALTLADQLHKATGGKSPAVLDNLAAAHAAAGDFNAAAATATAAAVMAKAAGEDAMAAEIQKHLAVYQKGLPWIE